MEIDKLIEKLKTNPENVTFTEVIETIDKNYEFSPTAFTNGTFENEKGQNSGSCKIFAFASLNQLTENQTLHCFGDYYRIEVLGNLEGENHQNIRNFIKTGWNGVRFQGVPLQKIEFN